MTDTPVDVIYRVMPDGSPIALFPAIPGTSGGFDCRSYQTVGQHGTASLAYAGNWRAATDAEAEQLVRELRSIGYNPRRVLRRTKRHDAARLAAVAP